MEKKKGYATVEATLILPIFIAAVVAFISFANLALIEMRMQYAVCQTAKEVSEYYYLACKFGLTTNGVKGNENVDELITSLNQLGDAAEDAYKTTTETVSNISVEEISNELSSSNGSLDKIKNIVNSITQSFDGKSPIDIIKALYTSYQAVKSAAGEVVSNAKNVSGKDIIQLVGNTAGAIFSTLIADPISEAIFPKYVTDGDLDTVLKAWMIEDGEDGLDFSASSFLYDGETIKVVVTYKVKLFTIGFWDFERNMSQVAVTRAWIGTGEGIGSGLKGGS